MINSSTTTTTLERTTATMMMAVVVAAAALSVKLNIDTGVFGCDSYDTTKLRTKEGDDRIIRFVDHRSTEQPLQRG